MVLVRTAVVINLGLFLFTGLTYADGILPHRGILQDRSSLVQSRSLGAANRQEIAVDTVRGSHAVGSMTLRSQVKRLTRSQTGVSNYQRWIVSSVE